MDSESTAHEFLHQECTAAAAEATLQTTCGVTLAPHAGGAPGTEVIVAMITLTGQVSWSVFLALPADTACGLVARFAGMEVPFDSSDMGDAVGELVNILAGDVKARLDSQGVRADISLPTVLRSPDVQALGRSVPTVKTCYTCQTGPLWLGVTAGTAADLSS